uniref:Reverse transcriptase domain-containing protein n=1 Tax=Cannabis sativa TaxID=3483 RepID=A0A803Q0A1_CANSA
MERMDSDNDDDFQYGPWMKGSKLPTNGHDRYHTDFSKANAWSLLTRLARNSLASSLPNPPSRVPPQPRILYHGESSRTIPTQHSHHGQNNINTPDHILRSLANTSLQSPSTGFHQAATITPPQIERNTGHLSSFHHTSQSFQPGSCSKPQLHTPIPHTPIYHFVNLCATAAIDQENTSPNVIPKRPSETMTLWKMLKWSRVLNGASASFSEVADLVTNVSVSTDSTATLSSTAEAPRIGLSGGLMLLWKDNVNVKLLHFGHTFFNCFMAFEDGPSFHFTAFYGAPAAQDRHASWTLLNRLVDSAPLQPWLVIGDFNEILSNADKEGGPLRNELLMADFRSSFDHCHLTDTPFEGDAFTWIKSRTAATSLKEHLDWCFINNLWDNVFVVPHIVHLDYFHSNHRAIAAVITAHNAPAQQFKCKRRFRFEKLWLADAKSRDIISQCWLHQPSHTSIDNVLHNLDSCATNLQKWHIGKYGRMKKTIAEAQTRVADLNNCVIRSANTMEELKVSESILDDLLEQEEMIKFLINDFGQKMTAHLDLVSVVEDYFQNIFQSSHLDEDALSSVLETIPAKVKPEMNNELTKPFTKVEIEDALKNMSPDKSPGIDETQSAFLPNRLITDNILVAFELVHAIKTRTSGRKGIVSLKLDMSKAFDRVEWCFIEEVMRKMGFAEQWINLIMTCLSTNTFSFTVNGEVTGSLTPTKGLRQGFKLTRNASPISHLLFADDSLLFCHANESSCLAIKTLSMPIYECHEKYLGLPSYTGRDKQQLFSDIKEKIWRLMHNWNEKIFSAEGREVLLKAVVQAIPTYIMSCFQLPLNVDAAVDANHKITGIGAVVRDSTRVVRAALAKPIIGNFSSHEMEAKAIFYSLNWVLQLQLPIAIEETDALLVVNAIRNGSSAITSYNDLIIDVTSLLSFFPQVNVVHAKRSANMVTHSLAKFALGVDETCSWLRDLPPPFYSVIVNDIPS